MAKRVKKVKKTAKREKVPADANVLTEEEIEAEQLEEDEDLDLRDEEDNIVR
jgi:uncharacterized protein YaiL (DUF2058 family)